MPHLMPAYEDATCIVNLTSQTSDKLRLRSKMFDTLTVYMPREYKPEYK